MTVRHKITLFIAGAGFLASLIFSGLVFWEMVEQPFRIIDSELKAVARRTASAFLARHEKPGSVSISPLLIESNHYWIRIYDQDAKMTLYRSHLASLVNIPMLKPGASATVSTMIPRDKIDLGQDRGQEVTFRTRAVKVPVGDRTLILQIGRPMERLEEGIWDILIGLVSGLAFSTMLLLAISYFVAGMILKPIGTIDDLTRDINERNLGRRIPVGVVRDEFHRLAMTINRMLDRLQQSFARQKRLLADASHELKTPLTMMRLSIDDVLSRNREDLPAFIRDTLIRQNEQVLRMERLVKNLLDLSRLEISESVKTESVDLNGLIQSLAEDYRVLADARNIGITIHLPENLAISADLEKLTRAFSNILDNAVKYNHDGGKIELVGEKTNNGVTVIVTNSGGGIPESDIDKVFDEFYRVEKSRALRYGGSGLGLAIVKRIIELHRGRVEIESDPGACTRVSIHLPAR